MPISTLQEIMAGESGNSNSLSSRRTFSSPNMKGKVPRRGRTMVTLENIDWWAVDPYMLLDVLPEISPDAGLALHNVLRLANPGWKITVRTPKGKVDKQATKIAQEMFAKASRGVDSEIPGAMGGANAFINTLLLQAYMKGAMCAETVLNAEMDDLDDIVPVEPVSIEFHHNEDMPGRYLIGQKQKAAPGGWRELNPNLVISAELRPLWSAFSFSSYHGLNPFLRS